MTCFEVVPQGRTSQLSLQIRAEGDPDGIRILDRKKAALAEASRLVALAKLRLKSAEIASADFDSLLNELAAVEKLETGKGSSTVPGRKNYRRKAGKRRKSSSVLGPTLFVDEAGRSEGIAAARSDESFALGAVSMTSEAVDDYIQAADDIKLAFFGDNTVTLHEPDMSRRTQPFHFSGDLSKALEFDQAIRALVAESDFTAFAVGVRKGALSAEFSGQRPDPYLPASVYDLAIHLLVERYVDYLAYHPDRPRAAIVMESQEAKPDALHQLTVSETVAYGTQWVDPRAFQN